MKITSRLNVVAGVALCAAASTVARPVLYTNGPIVSHPGAGFGGADLSQLNSVLGYSAFGFGHQLVVPNRVADDFTIPAGQSWTITKITFYGYQTNATAPTINHVNYQIWNAAPPGGAVVFGDTTTNRLTNAAMTNAYRAVDFDPTNTQRRISRQEVSCAATLPAGTYFLDWQSGGTLMSGPWANPVVIPLPDPMAGASVAGNALQFATPPGEWIPCKDLGTVAIPLDVQVAFPFIIEGNVISACYPDCDGNGTLNINDFICFQTKYALGDPYADCDGNGTRNINDFICFQTRFALGC